MIVYSNSVMDGPGLPTGTPPTPSKKWYWFNTTTNEVTHEWSGSWNEIQVDFTTIAKLRARSARLQGYYIITDSGKQGWFYRDLSDDTTADDGNLVIVTASGIRYKRIGVPVNLVTGLQPLLDIKVDKVTGKGLSTNDYTTAEKTKLNGVAIGATANDTDANLKNRANHTGTQSSATISDLTEFIQDVVAAFIGSGTNVTVSYDDNANTFTINSAGSAGTTFDAEQARDALGTALVGLGNIQIAVNDAADTITITTTATQNSTDAALRDRSTHTGTQPISSITDLQNNLNLKSNVNHTHVVADIGGLQSALDGKVDSVPVTVVHTSGNSLALANTTRRVVINPATTLANLTITLPTTPTDGQIVRIYSKAGTGSGEVVTTLTINSSVTIVQDVQPGNLVHGDVLTYEYCNQTTNWFLS